MSSSATATSRIADKESQDDNQHLLDNPEERPALEAPRVEPAARTLDEVARVERLLSQLEARSMALIPYGYGSLREAPARKSATGLLAGVLVALWLSSLVLAVAYIRYTHSSGTERASARVPLVITPESDVQEQKVANSVDHLASALVSSSERMNRLQAAMERSNRDLQKLASKVKGRDHGKTVSAAAKYDNVNYDESSAIPEKSLPRNWHEVLDIKPTESAVPHQGADGTVDYWLVPRGADQSPTKVLSIGTSAEGVVVHNLDDGKDYTLTPSGEWRNGSLATEN
jgi:hypothetical protein